jgi:hypothetical protein
MFEKKYKLYIEKWQTRIIQTLKTRDNTMRTEDKWRNNKEGQWIETVTDFRY